jgi:hypothetical protein
MNIPKYFITNEIIRDMKYYGYCSFTISKHLLIFPVALSLVRSRNIDEAIIILILYPFSVLNFGLAGVFFGAGKTTYTYREEVIPKLPEYVIDVVSKLSDEFFYKFR